MRVLLDTTYAARAPLSGTAVYLGELARALGALGGVELIAVANPRRRAPAGGGFGSLVNLAWDAWWTEVELPRLARRERADLIHHGLPALSRGSCVPQVVTVHDLAFERLPECFARGYRTHAHHVHRAAARRAAAVICVSETTAADARELWGVDPRRSVVARLGAGQVEGVAGVGLPSPRRASEHFLYVGDAEPRKNLGTLLVAYARYRAATAGNPLALVLVGPELLGEIGGPGVVSAPRPHRAGLIDLYARAAALVQPSLYEGFGLPALEAMSLGTPVIAARSPGASEICAGAARFADPRDPADLAAAMAELATGAELRATLSAAGRRRAAAFSWPGCARAHLDAYSLALRA